MASEEVNSQRDNESDLNDSNLEKENGSPFSFELELEAVAPEEVVETSEAGVEVDAAPPPPPRFLPHRMWAPEAEEEDAVSEVAINVPVPEPLALPPVVEPSAEIPALPPVPKPDGPVKAKKQATTVKLVKALTEKLRPQQKAAPVPQPPAESPQPVTQIPQPASQPKPKVKKQATSVRLVKALLEKLRPQQKEVPQAPPQKLVETPQPVAQTPQLSSDKTKVKKQATSVKLVKALAEKLRPQQKEVGATPAPAAPIPTDAAKESVTAPTAPVAEVDLKVEEQSKAAQAKKKKSTRKFRRKEKVQTPEQAEKARLAREQRRKERRRKDEKKRERELRKEKKKKKAAEAKLEKKKIRARKRDERLKARRQMTSAEQAIKKQRRDVWAPLERVPLIGLRFQAFRQKQASKQKEQTKKRTENRESQLRARYRALKVARSRRLGRNIVGLELGASCLRAVLLKEDEEIEVFSRPLPDGIIVDGLLEEPEELTAELKRLWQDSGLSSKKVSFSVSNRLVSLATTQLAAQKESDIPQALGLKADVLIAPMDPNKSVIDYAELSRSGPSFSLQVAAADEAMVKKYAKAIEKAGLLAVSCEIGALSMGRALRVPYSAREIHMVVDIGKETTSLIAASGVDIFHFRNLDIGGNDFTEAIQSQLNCSWAEADELKKKSGIAQQPADPSLSQSEFKICRDTMRVVADQMAQEIAQTRKLWEQLDSSRKVSSWSILGGGSELKGIKEQIALFTSLEEPLSLSPYPGLEQAPDLGNNATALGLARGHTMSLLPEPDSLNINIALPGMRRRSKISLQRARKEAKKLAANRTERRVSPKMIGVCLALAIFALSYYYSGGLKDDNSKLKENVALLQSQAKAKLTIPAAPEYDNSEAASDLSANLFTQPDASITLDLVNTVVSAKVVNPQLKQTRGVELDITGFLKTKKDVDSLYQKIKKLPITDSDEKLTNNVDGMKGFEIRVVAAAPLDISETSTTVGATP